MIDRIKRNKFWMIMAGIALGSVYFFIKLADNYVDNEGLVAWDRPINLWVQTIRTPWLNKIMLLITLAGNWEVILWGLVLGVILLWMAKKQRYLKAMLLSCAMGLIFTEFTKRIFLRPRPPVEWALIRESGFSFPSGHSYFAVVFYGLLTYFWFVHFRKKWMKIIILILGSGLILLLAFSRIYLGVHWTTDVLAGLSSSGAWLAVTISYIEYRARYFAPDYKEFNRKMVWRGFWIFTILWLAGWFGLYFWTAAQYHI